MAAGSHQIELNEAEAIFQRRMGLIYGPGITTIDPFYSGLVEKLQGKAEGIGELNYIRAAQNALNQDATPDAVKDKIRDQIHARRLFSGIKRIANLKWTAALSLALDNSFEAELAQACQKRASGFTSTQIISLPQVLGRVFKIKKSER